jgi:SAM-dependent methyltransferase
MSAVSSLLAFASQRAPRLSSRVLASSGYTTDLTRFGDSEVFSLWTAETAARQDRSWQPLVAAAKAGRPREDILALYSALEPLASPGATLLEVGCGGGYVSELIADRFPAFDYAGVDIAESMIELAHQHYPQRSFSVASAYELPFGDGSKDIVIDGVALIHMPGWMRSIAEYARVASSQVVLHGLTLTDSAPTTTFGKYAYGQPSMELVFNRGDVLRECEANGLTLQAIVPALDYDLDEYLGIPSVSETWTLSV